MPITGQSFCFAIPPGPEVAVQLVEVQGLRTEKIRIVDLPRENIRIQGTSRDYK